MSKSSRIAALVLAAGLVTAGYQLTASPPAADPAAALRDGNMSGDWTGYGRTYGEQHFAPWTDINADNVAKLGLAWSYDLPPIGNPMSAPLVIDGVMYAGTGHGIVRAFDATNGKLLWEYDSKSAEQAGKKLRTSWGTRGLGYWKGKVYLGSPDGRLIAIDAKTGKEIWSQMTVGKDDYRFISGPPRVFDGKVIIGHGGADAADTRGYVTTYDAETGKQLWRFHTVPGNPADGFENEAMEKAAKTWAGEWWKYGGGGTVWNTFTYDPDTDTILLGTGNGAPWNHKVRSNGEGDNLFLCSIVALDAKTGKYKWHYQYNPGETWDYNAAMDMQLADLTIDGKLRKVVIEAPKNGFVYVIDRTNGELISADKITYANWASHIDLKTGRPVENPAARFPTEGEFVLFPGPMGAHTWLPSAFSPKTNLVYLPVAEIGVRYDAAGYKPGWHRPPNNAMHGGYGLDLEVGKNREPGAPSTGSKLLAWDPVAKRPAWQVPTAGGWNGGVLATGGGLVFQGEQTGNFTAYDASTGKVLWRFDAQEAVLAPPISYRVKGRQYVTVITGMGTSAGLMGVQAPRAVDYRTQARRILTFAVDGKGKLPKSAPFVVTAFDDSDFKADEARAKVGWGDYAQSCQACHGPNAVGGGTAPDLRGSAITASAEAFRQIVHGGALVANGMPVFDEFDDKTLENIRFYLRSKADELRRTKR